MEIPSFQIHPNMNAEAYRNMNITEKAIGKDKHLQVIDVMEDERILLGGSNMTGRFWHGSISIYNGFNNVKDKPLVTNKTHSGVNDAFLITSTNHVVIGEDSGTVSVFKLHCGSDVKYFGEPVFSCQHNDSITSLSLFRGSHKFISSSLDFGIKIWDAENLQVLHYYQPAHVAAVHCIKAQLESQYVFSSVSQDGDALLWDTRKSKPARCIFSEKCGLAAVDWKSDNENVLVVGSNDGVAYLIDIRQNDAPLCKQQVSKRGLYRAKFHPKKSRYVAFCGNENAVKIYNIDDGFALIHEDGKHTAFVRGLAWQNDDLVTCGWDNEILKRNLPVS